MKKKTLAAMQFEHRQMAQMVEVSIEKSVEVIDTTFSMLASIDPGVALSVVESLESHKENLKNLHEKRIKDKKEYVDLLSSKMTDIIQLDDSTEEDEESDDEG